MTEGLKITTNSSAIMRFKSYIRQICLKCQHFVYKPKQILENDLWDDLSHSKAEYILNYTNNIIKFTLANKTYFFKEAKERRKFKEYIISGTGEFFSKICVDSDIEEKILKSLTVKSNWNKLLNSGNKSECGSPFNSYLSTDDERFLGLPLFCGADKHVVRKYIFYIYGEITNYIYNTGVKKGDRQTFLAVRALATKKLAEMLNIGDLIPETRYGKLRLDDCVKYGVLESEAHGINVSKVPCDERQKLVTPQLVRELTSLNVLDVLSYDKDHRANNYHTVIDGEGRYVGIMSYDNDGPDVFFPSVKIKFTNSTQCSFLIDKRGLINRPHMDAQLAYAVLDLKRKSVKSFSVYLNCLQRFCLWRRIKRLQKAIAKTIKVKPNFLLEKEDWTAEHVKEDLSGRYGKTYLVSFLTDCYYPEETSPFDIC